MEVLRSRIRESGLEVRTVETRRRGDAWAIAGEACRQGVRTLVVVGGDGTINEAVSGMTGQGVPILVVPVGTENILAKYLGIRLDGDLLWRVLERGPRGDGGRGRARRGVLKTRVWGLDQTNRRQFLLVAGVGFDAQIVHGVARRGGASWWVGGGGHISYWTYFRPVWRDIVGVSASRSWMWRWTDSRFYRGRAPRFDRECASVCDGASGSPASEAG